MRSFLNDLVDADAGGFVLRNERSGAVVAHRLLPALDPSTRNVGLLRHDALPDDTAMVLAPTSAVHTWFMRFPIDVLFVAKDGRVLKIREAVPAWRLALCLRAHAVIEMAAHAVTRSGTRVGDRLALARMAG